MPEAIQGLGALYGQLGTDPKQVLNTEKAPFGEFLQNAVNALQSVSNVEQKADATVKDYMAGKVGMEEALMEMTRMSLTVQFAVTIMNQGVTTFKEIQQIQV